MHDRQGATWMRTRRRPRRRKGSTRRAGLTQLPRRGGRAMAGTGRRTPPRARASRETRAPCRVSTPPNACFGTPTSTPLFPRNLSYHAVMQDGMQDVMLWWLRRLRALTRAPGPPSAHTCTTVRAQRAAHSPALLMRLPAPQTTARIGAHDSKLPRPMAGKAFEDFEAF